MDYKFKCPICEEVMEIVEEAAFEARRQRLDTPEAKALEDIDLILHEAEEGFAITVEGGA